MPTFIIHAHRFVEETTEIEVEALNENEARARITPDLLEAATWCPGDLEPTGPRVFNVTEAVTA